jgi:hypothetical protein
MFALVSWNSCNLSFNLANLDNYLVFQ